MGGFQFQLTCVRDFWRQHLRKVFLVMLAVLLVSAAVGYLTCAAAPDATTAVIDYFMDAMLESGVVDETGAISPLGLLLNNWIAILFCVLYGFLPFLFLPVIILFSNAYLIGAMGAYYRINGISLRLFFAGIIPHGVLELPALAMASAMGYILCLTLVQKLLHRPDTPPMVELLSDVLRTLLIVVFPLLTGAAVIEAYVTPVVMRLFA